MQIDVCCNITIITQSPAVTLCVKQTAILRSAHTVYLCVLCGSENNQRLFPYTALTDWFFVTETECVYCAVRTGALYIIQVTLVSKVVLPSPLTYDPDIL
jgi:hypothetical protein